MDAKSKANFINSVAGGQSIPCPACNSLNKPDARFCFSCGAKLTVLNQMPPDSIDAGGVSCPACNEQNAAEAVFCAFCGTKLAARGDAKQEQTAESVETEAQKGTEKVEEIRSAAGSPVFAPVKKPKATGQSVQVKAGESPARPVSAPVKPGSQVVLQTVTDESEEVSAFAQGLPSWNVVPPQVMVRRKTKR